MTKDSGEKRPVTANPYLSTPHPQKRMRLEQQDNDGDDITPPTDTSGDTADNPAGTSGGGDGYDEVSVFFVAVETRSDERFLCMSVTNIVALCLITFHLIFKDHVGQ